MSGDEEGGGEPSSGDAPDKKSNIAFATLGLFIVAFTANFNSLSDEVDC
jgi:hypothetical protein